LAVTAPPVKGRAGSQLENNRLGLDGHPLPAGLWIRVKVNATESFRLHVRDRSLREYRDAVEQKEIRSADDVHRVMTKLIDDWGDVTDEAGNAVAFSPEAFRRLTTDPIVAELMTAAIISETRRRLPQVFRGDLLNPARTRRGR
jgi:hypothetical protein